MRNWRTSSYCASTGNCVEVALPEQAEDKKEARRRALDALDALAALGPHCAGGRYLHDCETGGCDCQLAVADTEDA